MDGALHRYAPSQIDLSMWEEGCPTGFENSCKANSAVLRISFALTILFAVQMIGSAIHPKFYDVFWVPKFCIFVCVVIGFYFAKSSVFNLHGYAWFARISGFLYLILQQIILLDMAYSWNERWVNYSAKADGELGRKWLYGLVVISAILFAVSWLFIGIMYWQFYHTGRCDDNTAIITIALVLPILCTLVQVFFSDEGSLLISAIMTAYATYICYSAVSLNPDSACNSTIDTKYQTLSTVIGLVILVISMVWTAYSTICKIPVDTHTGKSVDLMSVATGGSAAATTGSGKMKSSQGGGGDKYNQEGMRALFVQVSFVFLLISGYYAMVLTNWATMQSNDSQSDPRTGRAAMWIQAAAMWIALLIYMWSLLAPKLFPNRDFGG